MNSSSIIRYVAYAIGGVAVAGLLIGFLAGLGRRTAAAKQ